MTMRTALLCLVLLSGYPGYAAAQDVSIWTGIFSAQQAQRGEEEYVRNCAMCHGYDLVSADGDAPSLTGPAFNFGWRGRTIAERYDLVRSTMPPSYSDSLTHQEHLDIITYILQFNGYPAGSHELKAEERGLLESIVMEPPR